MTIKQYQNLCHKIAVEKGFWGVSAKCGSDKGYWQKRNDGEMIALMHSELSEALEELRKGNPKSKKIPKFSEVEEEYADLIIRVADICGAKGYRLTGAIEAKMKYNKKRPYKHGKKF